jgi:hypothetical protein
LKLIGENMIAIILWFLKIRHSGTLFGCGSSPRLSNCSLYRLNIWSSWVRRKGTTQVMYIAKLKIGPKRVKKIFSMILEMVFEMVRWRGRKWNHIGKDFLKLKYLSPLKMLTSPLFEETFGASIFFFFIS